MPIAVFITTECHPNRTQNISMAGSNDGASNSKATNFDVEFDLLKRYEQMINTQINTLNGIDDKAASIARLVTILVGLLLSGASLIVG